VLPPEAGRGDRLAFGKEALTSGCLRLTYVSATAHIISRGRLVEDEQEGNPPVRVPQVDGFGPHASPNAFGA
jgi:hypothetical protein